MNLNDKKEFIRTHTDEYLDQFFGLETTMDLTYEGPDDLYLQGLDPRALYTSYKDLLEIMETLYLQGLRSWCDVGCGIGRSCFLWTWLFEETTSVGVEQVRDRIDQARSHSLLERMKWIEADFSNPEFKLPHTDIYYLYLATGPRFDGLLRKIKKIPGTPMLVVVESHGDMFQRLQWESWWLIQTDKRFRLDSRRHNPWGMVFQKSADSMFFQLEESFETKRGILPSELKKHPSPLSYLLTKSNQKNWEMVIDEQGEKWTMDTLGLEWFNAHTIKGQNPPRQVSWDQCTIGLRLIPEGEYDFWSRLRRHSAALTLATRDQVFDQVRVRKIFIQPEFVVELSNGSRIKVNDIIRRDVL